MYGGANHGETSEEHVRVQLVNVEVVSVQEFRKRGLQQGIVRCKDQLPDHMMECGPEINEHGGSGKLFPVPNRVVELDDLVSSDPLLCW